MSWKLAVVLLTLCLDNYCGIVQGEHDVDPRCPSELPDTTVTIPHHGVCYQFVDHEMYWDHADRYCRKHGGRLITINSQETQEFLALTLNNLPWTNKGVWIGLHDRHGEMLWEWSTENKDVGDMVTYTNWGSGHPRGLLHPLRDCVHMRRGRGQWAWHETFCSTFAWKYRFICQHKMKAAENRADGIMSDRLTMDDKPILTHTRWKMRSGAFHALMGVSILVGVLVSTAVVVAMYYKSKSRGQREFVHLEGKQETDEIQKQNEYNIDLGVAEKIKTEDYLEPLDEHIYEEI